MPSPIISVENLGKSYRINHNSGVSGLRYRRLSEELLSYPKHCFSRILHLATRRSDPALEDFWALKNVSFEVHPGEVVGIIGRNGAGKSTLLKLLSRITEPTTGRIELNGRVASLLEVGTGFHPELTGRENIFLNGAILGMTRAEIRKKFDEIVAFAEVERFLDTPVKRYSSGMYVRLAFSVAAHLDPEILVVDEVLAVGDASFQKRCLGRMRDVAQSGRTVLFVSHNMNAIEELCEKAILLEAGIIGDQGASVRRIITDYLQRGSDGNGHATKWKNKGNELNHPVMQPLDFAVVDSDGKPVCAPVRNDERIYVIIRADVKQPDPTLNAGFAIFNEDSQQLLWSLTTDGPEDRWPALEPGFVKLRCALPTRFFNEGRYRVEMIASLHCRDWFVRPGHNSPTVHFEIQGGLSDSPYWLFARPGIFAPEWKWERIDH